MTQRQGILTVDVRNPLTGAIYPAGTPIPMTAFARKVLGGSARCRPRSAAANNYRILQEFTNDVDKGSGKVDYQFSPALTVFGAVRLPRWSTTSTTRRCRCRRAAPATATPTRTNKQFATGFTWARSAARRCSRCASAGRSTVAGKNPLALGTTSALDEYGITGLPTDPRVAGGLPTQLITGYSDLGRQATNPQWQYPTMWNPKVNYTWLAGRHSLKTGYEFQHIYTEVQDVNPLYGRDTYTGQFTRPTGAGANNLYNLADFMFGLPQPVRAQQHPGREPAAAHALRLHPGRLARERQADAEPRPALRVRDAALGGRQHPLELRPGREDDDHGQGRLARRPGARQSGPQQLRAAARLRLHARRRRRSCAAATASATSTSTAPAPRTSCRSTARRSSTRS